MKKRRAILLGRLAVLALAGALILPAAYWQFIGWWRGEPFYDGRPVSYWRAEVVACEATYLFDRNCNGVIDRSEPYSAPLWYFRRPAMLGLFTGYICHPALVERVVRPVLGYFQSEGSTVVNEHASVRIDTPLIRRSSETLPILLEWLNDPDPKVRYLAIQELEYLGTKAKVAIPALAQALWDQGQVDGHPVHEAAEHALWYIDRQAWKRAGRPGDQHWRTCILPTHLLSN